MLFPLRPLSTPYPADLVISRSAEQATQVVSVHGDIDADTAPLLDASLTSAIGQHRQVCCDLSGVGFLGAAGVHSLLTAQEYADETGGTLQVRGVHGIAARVLRITGLDTVLTFVD